ncbi:MAG TPA: DNA-processing protein DprA, partial [Sphingobacteriaceae bacterium]
VISIVGTRNATEYGKELCHKLMEDLRVHNPVIVSGLAHGIDSLAHKEALNHQMRTVGVLGHGLDRIYPAQNRALAEKMLHEGGLLTEFPSGSNPDKENFPKRNRIIAGLADVTLVIEASIKGGALITAELANSYNRDVFAFPGRIDNPFSEGCNHLIKTNRANLIVGVKDLEYILNWNVESPAPEKKQLSLLLNLSPEEQKVADLLQQNGAMGIDDLALQSELPQSKLAITILGMEMQGLILTMPGKVYKLA